MSTNSLVTALHPSANLCRLLSILNSSTSLLNRVKWCTRDSKSQRRCMSICSREEDWRSTWGWGIMGGSC
ncbi:hypothetical protein FGO68_gene10623 [Halteria grandinella]|uniref:Uncharacterized protein n=1 Tax=Halteria grandinella TaxID=5974 RepID=A0A8J8T1J4_HALGN|nr:hypothetical protein FGO68_gene10623 [Halteria grandinella]